MDKYDAAVRARIVLRLTGERRSGTVKCRTTRMRAGRSHLARGNYDCCQTRDCRMRHRVCRSQTETCFRPLCRQESACSENHKARRICKKAHGLALLAFTGSLPVRRGQDRCKWAASVVLDCGRCSVSWACKADALLPDPVLDRHGRDTGQGSARIAQSSIP